MCRRSFLPLTLLLILSAASFAQDSSSIVRIGVPPLRSGTDKVSRTDARDRLVKALNHQKADRKSKMTMEAVALNESDAAKSWAEAKEKNCSFILSTRLTDLNLSEQLDIGRLDPSSVPGQGTMVPSVGAKLVYQLQRVGDRVEVYAGSATSEKQSSPQDAVFEAIRLIATHAIGVLKNVPATAFAASAAPEPSEPKSIEVQFIGPDYCKWLPGGIAHIDGLRGVCEYAKSLPEKMPNFICDQETSRYRGENRVPRDLITAVVRYEDGNESYSQVKLNGRPAPAAITDSPGLWSTGEFGSNLRAVFDMRNQPLFEFAGENSMNGRAAWVFRYRILKQNDPLWRLHSEDATVAPPYEGELWIDRQNGDLLRFRATAREIPADFPTQSAELLTDYDNVAFGDNTSFLLPITSAVATKYRGEEPTRNVLQFRNCHKFRAKTHMLLDVPRGIASNSGPSETTAGLDAENAENENIYNILREQAIREDAVLLEREQRKILEETTLTNAWRMADLVKGRQKELARQWASVRKEVPPVAADVPVFKTSARLVPVSVVLRDAKGKALGNLRKEDFQLFDNGKAQAITSFSVETVSRAATQDASLVQNVGPAAGSSQENGSLAAIDRAVAYVFDDVHASTGHLAQAGAAATRHLASLQPNDRAALFTTSGRLTVDFTADRRKLLDAIQKLTPHSMIPVWNCPPISPYMADLMVNEGDMDTIGMATGDAMDCAFHGFGTALEMQQAQKLAAAKSFEILNASGFETREALRILHDVIRRTAAMPGHRSIVLVSPGFLTLAVDQHQDVMELVEQALQSDIVVNTLDVRGLLTNTTDASMTHPSDPVLRQRLDREAAESQSGVLFELAEGTGGTYFHNNNDMNEGFRRTADRPDFVYVLGFSPQKLDGKFHKLKVKLAVQQGLNIQARQGYYALKPASNP